MEAINPTVGAQTKVTVNDELKAKEAELDKEYIDKRSITISVVRNYSNYRKANGKVLGQKKEVIGSSITSSRILSSNKSEVEKYFPALIGLSPNNPEFITRVKSWLSNIHVPINENDTILNISFVYDTKRDYLDFKRREEAIENEYSKVNRANTSAIKEALKTKLSAINLLESEKHKVGHPVNLEHYLLYRHCLLYRDVAKDTAIINSEPYIRFYIKDEAKEIERQKKLTQERLSAMRNFIDVSASDIKFNAIYISIVVYKNDDISQALLKDKSEKIAIVMDFVNTNPDRFNKFVKDSNIITKAFIETLIVRGELVRSEFNQQISTADGTFIGANINEAVAYFNNPNNKDIKTAYENKLKLF